MMTLRKRFYVNGKWLAVGSGGVSICVEDSVGGMRYRAE